MKYLAREWLKYHPQQASDWLWYCRKRRLPLYSQSEQAHLTGQDVILENAWVDVHYIIIQASRYNTHTQRDEQRLHKAHDELSHVVNA